MCNHYRTDPAQYAEWLDADYKGASAMAQPFPADRMSLQ